MAAVAVPRAAGHRVGAQQADARGELLVVRVRTIPPSPTASCFLEKNERQVMSDVAEVAHAEALRGVLDQREAGRPELSQRRRGRPGSRACARR